jgi:hypothetical protein
MRPYQGHFGNDDTDGIDTAYRIVADHVRALTFILSDGGIPGSVGSGYVLRHILRRGALTARNKLGVKIGSFFSSLMPVVVENLVRDRCSIHDRNSWLTVHRVTSIQKLPEGRRKFKKSSTVKNAPSHKFWRRAKNFSIKSRLARCNTAQLKSVVKMSGDCMTRSDFRLT